MATQQQKAQAFRKLHARETPFIIPNPWDVGTARALAALGFEALATTSAGFANSVGKRDGAVGREAMLAHVRTIVDAVDLPVSADLENGYGDEPSAAAETIGRAAETGLAGGSIEDSTGRREQPLYELPLAAERIRAAAEAARTTGFVLTARAENYLVGRADLADTIRRLQAYQEAGADVLYAPALVRAEDIRQVVRSVDRPVNVLMGMPGVDLSLAQLAELGVRRVSLGSGLFRVAMGALVRAAREMSEQGTFTFMRDAAPSRDIAQWLGN